MTLPQGYYQQPGYVVAAGVVLPLLSITAVALRLWARLVHCNGLKADDWLIIPAAVWSNPKKN